MARPTPGNWTWQTTSDPSGAAGYEVNSDYGTFTAIATVVPNDLGCRRLDDTEARLNAMLIAAAPDMLAALKAALHQMEHSTGAHNLPALFRGVIAKAEGRSE